MSEQEKSLLEILTDENDVENFVLQGEDGTETEFEQIATIPLENEVYCILRPLNAPECSLEEDEALVFKLEEDDASLSVVEDEGLAQLVFDEYYKLCDEDDNPET